MSDEKPKMCGDCRNHEGPKGTHCDKHPGVYRATAAACDDFVPKVSQPTGGPHNQGGGNE